MTGSLDESRRLQDAALASLGLFRYKVPEDGNCMFRAVASQLQLDQDHYHTVLRESASAWIQQHVNDLVTAGLLESVSEIQDTATEGKWCGQAALVALANVLKVNIAVVQGGDQGSIDIQHVAPFDGVTSKEHPGILLAYLYNGHYDAVVHEPNVSNPDYAVWSAKCHYNEAISKKVAHKLSDVTRTPPAVRALLRDRGDNNTSNVIKGSIAPKVSTMKIDLQPAKPFVRQDSGIKLTSLRNQHRRPSVDSIRDSAVSSPRGVSFRSTRSETEGMPAKRAQSEARDFRQRRASSPGPTTTRQSPFTSIRAAVEKHRRRSSSREGPVDLPYNYDGSIRLFGASNKPGSLTGSREASPHNKQNRENIYSKENLRRAASAGSKPGEKRSTTPVKNYGIDLKSTGRKITRQSEHEEEYMAPRHLPPKQMSLNKDFGKGDAEQSRNDVRRSSEGTNQKKTPGMPAAYATSKPSFGVDYTSKAGQESPKQLVNSTTKQNGFHSKESNDNTSKVPPKVPPKVLPKPPTPQESKKMTVIPIRLSSSKTADKAQQLPSHPVLNGYDGVQRSPRIRTISQQETPGTSSQQQQQQEQQQQQQRHQQQQQQRQQRQQQQHQRQQQHLNRASSSPQSSGASSSTTSREQLSKVSQQEIPSTSSQQQHHLNRASSSPQSSAGSSSTKSREQLSKEATERQYQRMRDVQPNANQQGAPRTRTRSRNGTAGQQSPRVRTRAHKENFEGYHKERVRSRERRQSTDHQQRKIAEAAREAHQVEIDTADIVTTPTEPSDTKKKQLLPFVGTSPSQCRKVNVQVSTEDRDETCQTEAEPIVLRSPRMVRDASTGGSTYAARGVGCITSIPLSPISTSPYIESLSSVAPPHLSPGPYSPGPASTSIPSSPAPGISRVVQLTNSKDSIHEIPLRSSNSLEQQPQQIGGQRRRSVVEIQPQQLQTPSTSTTTSTGRGVINMLLKKTESKGKTNGTTHKSKARMFFS